MSLLYWGTQTGTQCSRHGLTRITSLNLLVTLFIMQLWCCWPSLNKDTLLACGNLTVYQDNQILLCRAASQSVGTQPVLVRGVMPPKVQDFTFTLDKIHEVAVSPSLQLVLLNSSRVLQCTHHFSMFAVVYNRLRKHSIPLSKLLLKIIDHPDPSTDPWRARYSSAAGLCTSHYKALSPEVQLVFHITHLSSSYHPSLVMETLESASQVILKWGYTAWVEKSI